MGIDTLVSLVIYLVVVGLIFWLVMWFIGYVGVPEPFNKIIRVVVGLVMFLLILGVLMSLLGGGHFVEPIHWR